jgi:hypothetical protein
MLCDIAIWADTSSNQAIKDLSRRRYNYNNLNKIKSVTAKRVAVMFVVASASLENSCFPISSD